MSKISLVGSDVDGTLVISQEALTDRARGGSRARRGRHRILRDQQPPSQSCYLDPTPADTGKCALSADLARRLSTPASEIATIGNMGNDVSMFRNSGFAIATENASTEMKRAASAVTLTNDGFADAIERIVLPRAQGRAGPI